MGVEESNKQTTLSGADVLRVWAMEDVVAGCVAAVVGVVVVAAAAAAPAAAAAAAAAIIVSALLLLLLMLPCWCPFDAAAYLYCHRPAAATSAARETGDGCVVIFDSRNC